MTISRGVAIAQTSAIELIRLEFTFRRSVWALNIKEMTFFVGADFISYCHPSSLHLYRVPVRNTYYVIYMEETICLQVNYLSKNSQQVGELGLVRHKIRTATIIRNAKKNADRRYYNVILLSAALYDTSK